MEIVGGCGELGRKDAQVIYCPLSDSILRWGSGSVASEAEAFAHAGRRCSQGTTLEGGQCGG